MEESGLKKPLHRIPYIKKTPHENRNSSIKQNTGGGIIRTNPPIFTKPIEGSIHPAPGFNNSPFIPE